VTRPHVIRGWRIEVRARPGIPRVLAGAAVARVVAAALAAAGAPTPASLTVLLTDDEELEDLNVTHLGHDGPTDVLSFPLLPPDAFTHHEGAAGARAAAADGAAEGTSRATPPAFVLPPTSRPHLGDLAISVERAIVQASEGRGGQTGDRRWDAASELRLLVTHGTLHLCGWDHAEPGEEAAMRALERSLLGVAAG
jgi:probable rRNA maturation factor